MIRFCQYTNRSILNVWGYTMLSFNQQQSQSQANPVLDVSKYPRAGVLLIVRTGLLICWTALVWYLLNIIWGIYILLKDNWIEIFSNKFDYKKLIMSLDLPWPLTIPDIALWVRITLFLVFVVLLVGCVWATRDIQRELKARHRQEVDEGVTQKLQDISDLLPKVRRPPFDIMCLPPPEYFVGRDEDVRWLLGRLRTNKSSVTILSGIAGIGKTSLASYVIRQLFDEKRFRGGIIALPCQSQTDAAAILQNILGRFDPQCHQMDIHALQSAANRLLDEKDILIVLDNVESKLDIETIVTALRVSTVKLLLTSQQRLLSHLVPIEANRVLKTLSPEDALKIFIKPLGHNSVDLTPEKMKAAWHIVEILGYHTLAVKLAGAQVINFSRDLETLARELEKPEIVIELTDSNAPSAVKRAFNESIKDLPSGKRKLFIALAAFPTLEFSRKAVLVLAEKIEPGKAELNLNMLLMRALIEAFPNESIAVEEDRERLRMHPLLNAFAYTLFKKLPSNEQESIQLTVARYYAGYVTKTSDIALNFDEKNITGSLEWIHLQKEKELEATICAGMEGFWMNCGRTEDVLPYIQWGINAAEEVASKTMSNEDLLQATRLKLTKSRKLHQIGEIDKAETVFQEILGTRRMVGDKTGEGEILIGLGQLEQQRGRLDAAIDHYEQGLSLLQDTQNGYEGQVLRFKGDIAWQRGRREEAEGYYRQSQEFAKEMEDRKGEAQLLLRLGEIAQVYEQFRQAGDFYKNALIIMTTETNSEKQNQQMVGCVYRCLAHLAQVNGQGQVASNNYHKALEIAHEVEDRLNEGMILMHMGSFAQDRKQYPIAQERYKEALSIVQEVQFRQGECRILWHMGNLARMQKAFGDAEECYESALKIAREVEDVMYYAHISLALGILLIEQRKNKASGDIRIGEAIQYYKRMGLPCVKEAQKTAHRLGCNI